MLVTLIKHYLVTGVAQRERAGLITLRTLVRTQPPELLQFVRFKETNRHSSRDVNMSSKQPFTYRCGAEEARVEGQHA